jgi:polyhydroxyalkanoate synthesis regulator phasin
MAQEAWRAYLELALGVTDATRKKATKTVKRLVGKSVVSADQLQSMAEDLLKTSSANREAMTKLVRYELDRALGAVGLATADEVASLTTRVRELEAQLRAASAPAGKAPVKPVGAEIVEATEAPAPLAKKAPAPVAKKVAKKTAKKAVPAPVVTDLPEPIEVPPAELAPAEPLAPPTAKKAEPLAPPAAKKAEPLAPPTAKKAAARKTAKKTAAAVQPLAKKTAAASSVASRRRGTATKRTPGGAA